MIVNPLTAVDFYKTEHRRQYPSGTTEVYSNFTPRSHRESVLLQSHEHKVVFFGLQYFIKQVLLETWQREFFSCDKLTVLECYRRRLVAASGDNTIDLSHIAALHDLGYLPLKIKALPEGTRVPIGVPVLTVVNTHPDFFWLTNFIESILSCYLWKPITSATIAFSYRQLCKEYAQKTAADIHLVPYQVYDFSMRGSSGLQDCASTGAAHLTSFYGTASIIAIDLLETYYDADVEKSIVGYAVPSTEHSVMCMQMEENELAMFRRLITEIYPNGRVSIVSDSWDYWRVISEYLPQLKPDILARDGKVIIRPDSGDPLKIICGDPNAAVDSPAYKGSLQCLWELFGGTHTKTGHKLLDPHIGLIYGDSITLQRAQAIFAEVDRQGFASTNITFGIGSLSYQTSTRDSFGFAMKATSGIVNGERRDIIKNPKTDDGLKKSAKGLLRIERQNGELVLFDQQTEQQEAQGLLETVFIDGNLIKTTTLDDIRQRLG